MQVLVNDIELKLLPGMAVRHALISAGLLKEVEQGKKVFDQWGNQLGLDGALTENAKIYVK